MDTLYIWFQKGGFIMWPLLIASIFALGVVLERGFTHLRSSCRHARQLERIKNDFRSGSELSCNLCRHRSPAARIAAVYFRYARETDEMRTTALQREGDRILADYNRNLKVLSTVAHAAPLLGLLGTVAGLVAAFYQIESSGGRVQPADLAGGIWEALLTTVAGLSVGIPSLLAFHYFQSSGDKAARRMQEVISELDEIQMTRQETSRTTESETPNASTV